MIDTQIGIYAVVGMCVLVLLLGMLKKRAHFLLNFMVRAVVCLILAYFLNSFLAARGMEVHVGMNAISVLTCGSLGIFGLAGLYGVLFLQLL